MFAYDDYGYEANAWMRREKNQWQKRERSLGGLIKHHFHLAGTRKHFIYVCVLLWLDSRKKYTHTSRKKAHASYIQWINDDVVKMLAETFVWHV